MDMVVVTRQALYVTEIIQLLILGMVYLNIAPGSPTRHVRRLRLSLAWFLFSFAAFLGWALYGASFGWSAANREWSFVFMLIALLLNVTTLNWLIRLLRYQSTWGK
ncbi:MAG: hypothetical protein V1755_02900 [Chloroflexota bacterium]